MDLILDLNQQDACSDCQDEELSADQVFDAVGRCAFCNSGFCDDHKKLWEGEVCCTACYRIFSGEDDV